MFLLDFEIYRYLSHPKTNIYVNTIITAFQSPVSSKLGHLQLVSASQGPRIFFKVPRMR
jgi:hypothetical protein